MTETGDRGGPASHHPADTGDDPSATVRQLVLRPRGIYVSKSDMVTDVPETSLQTVFYRRVRRFASATLPNSLT